MSDFDLKAFLVGLIVIVLSIALHEFGHAISADRLGDPGPRRAGRITLWPDKHFEIFGFIMILVTLWSGFGLGWGRPVMVNPRSFRHPRRDMVIVALCGPLMNLALALVFGLVLRAILATGHIGWLIDESGHDNTAANFLTGFVRINLSLMFFNLIPVHPLDGSKILSGILPESLSIAYDRFGSVYGPMILLCAIMLGRGVIGEIILPAVATSTRLITGLAL